jgi:AcrR family transcriptional regulator
MRIDRVRTRCGNDLTSFGHQAAREMATQKPKKRPSRKSARRRWDIDLPAALLEATENILREHGLDKFTLREAARRAGVSHGAPAFHFGDVSGLLTAFAAQAFAEMTALMVRYRLAAAKDPRSQLVATGCAYIDYAIAHRPQFQLMFRRDRIREDDPRYVEASKQAFLQLEETMRPFLKGAVDDGERAQRLTLAWSAVHGFATLVLENRLVPLYGAGGPQGASRAGKQMLELLTLVF